MPSAYRQVEYLESTNVQWIDTGVIDDGNTDFEIAALYVTGEGYFPALLGSRIGGDAIMALMFSNSNNLYCSSNLTIDVNGTLERHLYNFHSDTRSWSVDDGEPQPNSKTNVTNLTIFLFGYNNPDKRLSDTRIYSFKATKENAIIADFIPCYRKADNKPGMYDIVSGEFFVNQGTGADFILGPKV